MSKYKGLPKFGLAIDFETSGYSFPNYAEKHQGISFGAIIYDSATFEPVESIYREIKFNASKYQWDYAAEKIHGLSKDFLNDNGVTQEEAAVDLANLIIKYNGTEDVQLLGHRVQFDKAFMIQLMDSIDIQIPFHSTFIDSCTLGSALLELAHLDDIFDALSLPPRGLHNSLEDIMYTLQAVKKMKEHFLNGISSTL